jgi:hypothetical protein
MFILIVLAFFVLRYDVSVIEKLALTLLVAMAALAPRIWPQMGVACAVFQALLGVYVVLRMHYERVNSHRS